MKIQTFIMQGDGPLPYDYRHYLAIMVSIFIWNIGILMGAFFLFGFEEDKHAYKFVGRCIYCRNTSKSFEPDLLVARRNECVH